MRFLLLTLMVVFVFSSLGLAQLSITIDGQRDAFYDGLNCPTDGHIIIPNESWAVTPNSTNPPDDDLDLSTSVWVAWDETYLYYYEERKDEELAVTSTTGWQNDGVELKIDANPFGPKGTDPVDNVRLTVFDSLDADEVDGVDNLNKEGSLKNPDGSDWKPTTADYARFVTADGVNLEFRVPWAVIGTSDSLKVNVQEGGEFGMAINIADNDGTTRETQLMWAAVVADENWSTPELSGTMRFMPGNKLSFIAENRRDTTNVNANADGYTDPATCVLEIAIDGQRDSFYDGLACPEEGHIIIPNQPFAVTPNSTNPPDDDLDLSTSVWMAWDETYLYYYEERKDEELAVTSTTGWQNDGVELKIDANPFGPKGTDPVDNVRLTVFDSLDADEVDGVDNLNKEGSLKNPDGSDWKPTTADYARFVTADGVNLEFRVPWAVIGTSDSLKVNVQEGGEFGMAINIADNDGTTRETQLMWAAVVADENWSTPELSGTMRFMPGNKLSFIAKNRRDTTNVNENADGYVDAAVCATAIEVRNISAIADDYQLEQNYPNPFNPETKIVYSLKKPDNVSLAIYNLAGQLVNRLLSNERQPSGKYEVLWDGTDLYGRQVATGVYLYRLSTPTFTEARKMILVK